LFNHDTNWDPYKSGCESGVSHKSGTVGCIITACSETTPQAIHANLFNCQKFVCQCSRYVTTCESILGPVSWEFTVSTSFALCTYAETNFHADKLKIYNCLIVVSEPVGKRFSYNIGSVQTLSNKLVTEEKSSSARAYSSTGLRIIGLQFGCVVCFIDAFCIVSSDISLLPLLTEGAWHIHKGLSLGPVLSQFFNFISCLSCSRAFSSKPLLW
jgi:hypothetical protein